LTSAAQSPPSFPGGQAGFKAETNLVLVPAVVRDADGNALANLSKDDFQLFDNGKAQEIASFSIEETSGRVAGDRKLLGTGEPPSAAPIVIPEHFVALMFDDLHILDPADLLFVRRAASKFVETLKPADRLAIFTSSGPLYADFTSDRTKLSEALSKLQKGAPASFATSSLEERTRQVLLHCDEIVRRMSSLPGQRTLVVISPGLPLYGDHWTSVPVTRRLIDNAIRSRVVIGGIDAGGLTVQHNQNLREFQARVSDGTGGTFIRDTNDLDGAVRRLAATPEYIYVLGFAPQTAEHDNSFHRLTVKLRKGLKVAVQARQGYWPPDAVEPVQEPDQPVAAVKADAPRVSEAETKELARALDIQPANAPPREPPINDEVVTSEQPVTFKAQSNLVEVLVVARDRAGHAMGNLRQEDFRVLDKGKPQEITKFSVQKSAAAAAIANAPAHGTLPSGVSNQGPAPATRYVAFVFDDLHIRFEDLPQVREAVRRYLRSSLHPEDRAALFTTSGKIAVDFTAKPEALGEALLRIVPNPLTPSALHSCLYISYSQAVQIEQQVGLHPFMSDLARSIPLNTAYYDATQCLHLPDQKAVFDTAVEEARQEYDNGEQESRATLATLRDVIRRMAVLPGQRTIVLASPGFFVPPGLQNQGSDLIAQAIRSKVLISTIDARGVWANPVFDATMSGGPPPPQVIAYRQLDGDMAADELIALAEGTGGIVNRNNDFDGGIRKAASAPEYTYILGFSPQNLKADGSFHALKVTARSTAKVSLQARRGYWAPNHAEDELALSKEEIENAVFSRDEIHSLPAEMHTQVTKDGEQVTLNVLTSLDLKLIQFRKADGRNRNDVTIVAALFDVNGNFIAGKQKLLKLRLRDETVRGLEQKPPIVIATGFEVKPGAYLVRLVVRDEESREITAENAAAQIP
jgi:VWFA-related protein